MNLAEPFFFPSFYFFPFPLLCFPLYHLAGLLLLSSFDIFFPIPLPFLSFILLDFLVFGATF